MLYTIGTTAEIPTLPSHLPKRLLTEVFQGLVVLDCEYGADRNYLESGGYSIIAETEDIIIKLNVFQNLIHCIHINFHVNSPSLVGGGRSLLIVFSPRLRGNRRTQNHRLDLPADWPHPAQHQYQLDLSKVCVQ